MSPFPNASRVIVTFSVVLVAACCEAHAAPLLPLSVHEYLNRVRPELSDAIAADAKLLQEVGARNAQDLANATYDYAREVRFFHLDARRLAKAERLEDAVVASDRYCVPYCVGGTCRALMCFQYDERSGAPTLLSVGRSEQALRLQEGQQRIRALGASADAHGHVVLAGAHELFFAEDAETGDSWLAPATKEQAERLTSAAGGRRDRISLAELRALVEGGILPIDEITSDDEAGREVGAADAPQQDAHEVIDTTPAPDPKMGYGTAYATEASATTETVNYEPTDMSDGANGGDATSEALITTRLQQAIFLAAGFALLAMRVRKRRFGQAA